jgi:hypothetical protein
MLIPFKINDELVKQFNIPQYIVDWNRIKILKIVDDMRFLATRSANMDLSSEALLIIKFFHLCLLAMPKIDSSGKVISIDPIAQCYDVSKEDIISALDELSLTIKNWRGDAWTPNEFYNFLTLARNNKLYFAKIVTGRIYTQDTAGLLQVTTHNGVSIAEYDEEQEKLWPSLYALVMNPSANKINGVVADIMFQQIGSVEENTIYYANKLNTSIIDGRSPNSSILQNPIKIRNPHEVSMTHILDNISLVVSPKVKTPKLFDFLMLQANIDERYARLSMSLFSIDVLFRNNFVSKTDDGFVDVIEPNPLFGADPARYKSYSAIVYDGAGNRVNRSGHSYIPLNVEYYYDGYIKRKFTLNNGKSYSIPVMKISQKHYVRPITFNPPVASSEAIFGAGAIRTEITDSGFSADTPIYASPLVLKYFKMNKSKYSFPLFYPGALRSGAYKVRNGYLYSDASSLYELTFLQVNEKLIDILSTFVNLQISIKEFKDDMSQGQVFTETMRYYKGTTRPYDWVAPAFTPGRMVVPPAYDDVTKSYYYDNGQKMPFVHPITLRPVLAEQYFNELLFECIDVWGQMEKEFENFFLPLKNKNDNAYQMAYQNFLRAEATIKGPEALAEYELKLKTGVFYSENNFTYWRPFTEDEKKLAEKFREEAFRNGEIMKQNEEIKLQNKMYQDKVNEAARLANQIKLAEAQAMANTILRQNAEAELAKIVVPTINDLIAIAEKEGGYPTDALARWVDQNPNYYLREDVLNKVKSMLKELTNAEQKVATALVTNVITEVRITQAFEELFKIKG